MGIPAPQVLVSEADYLESERDAATRHEYVDGVLFAMTEASRAHNQIATNLTIALGTHLRGSGCRVAASDMKVRLGGTGHRYYYPDAVVSCSDPDDEPDAYTETRPVLVVEILSPSTAVIDRREKRLAYQAMPSVIDYLIVSQERREVERFTRAGEGWTQTVFGAQETVELVSVGFALAMEELYADVAPGA